MCPPRPTPFRSLRPARSDRRSGRSERWSRPAWRFFLSFAGIAAALFALYRWSETSGRFAALNALDARVTSAALYGLGIPHARDGTSIVMTGGGLEIVSECSGVSVVILFAAGVLAFPAPFRARVAGLGFGLPLLALLNLMRLVSVGIVQHAAPHLVPAVHLYLWQVLFVLAVAALYLLWIERIVARARPRPAR